MVNNKSEHAAMANNGENGHCFNIPIADGVKPTIHKNQSAKV